MLGLLAAGVGVAFIRVLYGIEDLLDHIWRGPDWLRPGLGGVLLGLLLLALLQMYGVGYPVLEAGIRGDDALWFLLVLMAGDLAQSTPTLSATQTLEQALGLLVRHEHPGLPVLAADGQTVIGWLTHRDVLHAYNERLERSVDQAERTAAQLTPGTVPAPGTGHEHPQSAHLAARAGRVDRQARQATQRTPGALPAPGISQAQRKGAQVAARDGRPEPDVYPLLDRLHGYRIIDLELTRDQPPARQRVMDVQWPPSTLVMAVRRNHQTFAPNGQTELRKGDRLTVLVPAEHAETLAEVVHATQHCSPRG